MIGNFEFICIMFFSPSKGILGIISLFPLIFLTYKNVEAKGCLVVQNLWFQKGGKFFRCSPPHISIHLSMRIPQSSIHGDGTYVNAHSNLPFSFYYFREAFSIYRCTILILIQTQSIDFPYSLIHVRKLRHDSHIYITSLISAN